MVVIIAGSSLILLVFLQNFTESTVRNNIYDQQIERQAEVTNSISQSIGSDLGILVSVLTVLQILIYSKRRLCFKWNNQLHWRQIAKIWAEVNDIFLLDRNNMVTLAMPGQIQQLTIRTWRPVTTCLRGNGLRTQKPKLGRHIFLVGLRTNCI